MIITKRFFIPLLLTLVRAEDGLVSKQQEDEDLERDLFEELETKMDLFSESTDGKKAGGLRGLQNSTSKELSTEDLTGEGNPNPVFDSLGEDNVLRNLDIEEDNVIQSTFHALKAKHPEIASLVEKYYPVFDFDDDCCLPAAAIGKNGAKNGGLKTTGSPTGGCRSSNFLTRSNTYYRWALIKGKGTVIMFALYFEKDQGLGGHRHDWEDVVIWIDENNNPKKVYWSAHGKYGSGKKWADAPKEGNHPKIVYHQGGATTRSFRLAKGGEISSFYAENPKGYWVCPKFVGWYEMTGNGLTNYEMRTKLNSFDYGSAHCGFKDNRFQTQIGRAIGDEVDMGLVNFFPGKSAEVYNYDYNRGWRVDKHLRLLADVNGDGKLDIVGFGGSKVLVTLAAPSVGFETPKVMLERFTYNSGWSVEKHPRFLADVNGDGRADIVGFYGADVFVSLSYGTGFTDPEKKINNFGGLNDEWSIKKHPRFVTDMNGDGKADIVGFGEKHIYVAYANGSGFDAPIIISNSFVYASGWRVDKHLRFLEDVNGDGKKDIIGIFENEVYVSYSNGNGWDAPKKTINKFGYSQGWRIEKHPRFVTDMNGDGKADIVGFGEKHVFVSYSNGNGFNAPIIISNSFVSENGWGVKEHPRFLEDVNGDGKKDIVGFYGTGVYMSISNRNGGWDAPKKVFKNYCYNQGWRADMHPRFVADMNGDGYADVVGFGGSKTFIRSLTQ